MQKILLKHKKYLIFILFIFIVFLLLGILYYNLLDNSIKKHIFDTLYNYNNFNTNMIIKDLIIMSTILVSSFFVIGIPLSLFYVSYEFFTIGFLINLFLVNYKIKGLLYILVYIVLNKLFTLPLIIIFIYKIINISRYIIGFIIYKDKNIKDKILINFNNCIYIIIFVLIINILLSFILPLIKLK